MMKSLLVWQIPLNKTCPSCSSNYMEIRYKKVGSGYEKYINCPNCGEKYTLENESTQ